MFTLLTIVMADDDTPVAGDGETPVAEDEDTSPGGEEIRLCDFCRLPIPGEPALLDVEGAEYEYCSDACRQAMQEAERVFTEYHGHRRIDPGVTALSASLPEGLPRNVFVLLSGQPGTRDDGVNAELVWRTLKRGEPAVYVTFQEPPGSVVQSFISLRWNVLPYLESGQLQFLDCFTDRLEDPGRMFDRLNDWNRHLFELADRATTTVRDPSDVSEVTNKLDNVLERQEMNEEGAVVIDSLTEFGTLVQPIHAYRFVKDVRAEVCKARYVPIFASASRRGSDDGFPHDLDYTVDGVVDLAFDDSIVKDTLIKRVRIRKMNGVLAIPQWRAFEYTGRLGMVTFDPLEEIASSESNGQPPEDGPDTAQSGENSSNTDGDVSGASRSELSHSDTQAPGPGQSRSPGDPLDEHDR